jgi:hypothetical protein
MDPFSNRHVCEAQGLGRSINKSVDFAAALDFWSFGMIGGFLLQDAIPVDANVGG